METGQEERIGFSLQPFFSRKEDIMLGWALTFLVIALVAAVLGFTGIAGVSAEIAKILFIIFLVMFVIFLFMGRKKSKV